MIHRILKYTLLVSGCLFLILLIFCLTPVPFYTWYSMSTKHAGIHRPPDIIVVLGGGGMPSESGLMRTWYAGRVAKHFPRSKVIIALPGDTTDSLSSVCRMKKELVIRGIAAGRISFESAGTNTRAQALNISAKYRSRNASLLIITSPEHLYRAVLAFRKGCQLRTDGVPAFEAAIESDITFDDRLLGGRRWMPRIGKNISARYEFWTQMHYEQLITREWIAIVYYKLQGWI
jgi:uncharacterized SAM-binding protein YcdF (DUF218 family)